jgi:hypothetical protein
MVLIITNTINTLLWSNGDLSAFSDGGKRQVSLCALFQAQAGTPVKPPSFKKLAGYLPNMKESKVPGGIQTHKYDRQVVGRKFH